MAWPEGQAAMFFQMIYQQDNHGEDYLINSIPIGNDLRPF
jgi:hypothetical protein